MQETARAAYALDTRFTEPTPREGSFEVRLAQGPEDLRSAQRLRFEVFNLELELGLAKSFAKGLDSDVHDAFCDHILVVDRGSRRTVGTYRLLPPHRVPSFGFYSESEFHIDNVKRTGLRLLELGRSCVAPEYRTGPVISLLFRGVAEYAKAHRIDALMGCASLHGGSVESLRRTWTVLKKRYLADPSCRVLPREGFDVPAIDVPIEADEAAVLQGLPPLFKGYLRLGAKVCGPPAHDRQFGTTDFFVLAPLANVAGRYERRFPGLGKVA